MNFLTYSSALHFRVGSLQRPKTCGRRPFFDWLRPLRPVFVSLASKKMGGAIEGTRRPTYKPEHLSFKGRAHGQAGEARDKSSPARGQGPDERCAQVRFVQGLRIFIWQPLSKGEEERGRLPKTSTATLARQPLVGSSPLAGFARMAAAIIKMDLNKRWHLRANVSPRYEALLLDRCPAQLAASDHRRLLLRSTLILSLASTCPQASYLSGTNGLLSFYLSWCPGLTPSYAWYFLSLLFRLSVVSFSFSFQILCLYIRNSFYLLNQYLETKKRKLKTERPEIIKTKYPSLGLEPKVRKVGL